MNKEAIKLLEEAIAYKGDYAYVFMCKKINQALLKEQPEPKCETCGDTKQTPTPQSVGFGIQNAIMQECPDCTEQPPAGEFREIVSNRFPIFLPDSYEGMKSLCAELTDTINEACARLDRSEAGERILEERIEKLSDTLDSSEASREELLTACRQAFNESHNPNVEKILKAAIK